MHNSTAPRSLVWLLCLATAGCGGGTVPADGDADPDPDGDLPVCVDPLPVRQAEDRPDATFDLGPYLMQPQPTGIVVMWRTLLEADGEVVYATGDGPELTVAQEGRSTIHEIALTGLSPSTRYRYQVRSNGVASGVHHFTTAPPPGHGFTAVAWGDSQDNPDTFSRLADRMLGLGPYLALGLGDLVSEGGEFSQWKERLFDPARALFHAVGFYTAMGNHARNHQNWYDLLSHPLVGDGPPHENYYSFSYGNAFFMVIDTDKPYFPILEYHTDISRFVAGQVASPEAQAATWRIAISHVPGYAEAWGDAVCESYGGDLAIREWLHPLLNEHGFHLHLSGHMHGYERGKSGNLVTVISGGGGGGLDAWCVDLPQVSVVQYAHHHLHLEAGCDTLRVSAYDLEGVRFDWVELRADTYGLIVDEGPIEGLPEPPIDPDSPHHSD